MIIGSDCIQGDFDSVEIVVLDQTVKPIAGEPQSLFSIM